jgi:hypothetical protein
MIQLQSIAVTMGCNKLPNGFWESVIRFEDGTEKRFRGWTKNEVQKKADAEKERYFKRRREEIQGKSRSWFWPF